MTTTYKDFEATIQPTAEDRIITAVISTDCIDRDGEVIQAKALDLGNYRDNPVVLQSHKLSELPVGRAVSIAYKGPRLIASVRFSDTPRGNECLQLYKEGVLNAFSVGFTATDVGPPTGKEIAARPELRNCRAVIRKGELLEFSVVAVPANPEALVMARTKGINIPEWVEKPKAAKPDPAEVDDEPDEDDKPIKAGHYVEWGKGMSGGAGKVVSVHKTGKVPGVAESVECSEDEPGAKVKCYKAVDDKWKPTDKMMGHQCKALSRIPHPLDDEPDEDDVKPETKSASPYGCCPKCGAPVKFRERRTNGNDECEKGHTYPSSEAVECVESKSLPPLPAVCMTPLQLKAMITTSIVESLDATGLVSASHQRITDRMTGAV